MGELLRNHPWHETVLGDPSTWPLALKTVVSLMLASNQPMYLAWGEQRTLIYNAAYAEVLGSKHPSALGRDFIEVWGEIRAELEPIVAAAYRGETVQMDDIELVLHRHGYPEETNFSFFYWPIRDDAGAVRGLVGGCTDNTAAVVAQRRLRESEARHRGVLANMGEAFVLLDRQFRVLEVNDAALRATGHARAAMLGQSHWRLFPGTEGSEVGRAYKQALAQGQPAMLETFYAWPDGRSAWFEVRAYPVAEGLALFFHDITERRRIARDAAASAERLQLALDAGAIIGTWVWDVRADRFVADERFARSFGLDAQRCRDGLALQEVVLSIHPDDVPRVQQAVAEAVARGGPYRCEYRVRQNDGVYRWIEASGRVEMDAGGQAARFPGVLLDIEERRRAEAERDQATALLRTFIEAVPGVVYAKDRAGRMLVANRGTAELVGKPPEFFIGKTDAEFLDDKAQAAAVMATDRSIMESGQAQQLEEEVRLADGSPAWWLSTKAPLRDARGNVIGLIGSSVDITERKRLYADAQQAAAERKQLLDSERAARTEAERASTLKDEFLATLSHELRTPLSAILGWVHVLRRKLGDDATLQKGVDVIERSTRVQTQLIEDLLDMSRITSGKLRLDARPLAPVEVVEAALDTVRPAAAAAGVRIEVIAEGFVPTVEGDAGRLQQVVWNLLTNAVKFSPRGGVVTVRLAGEDGWARIEVSDSGVGIKPDFLPHVFDRFRQADGSTTRRFGGLGLGLAIVRHLAELHGGTVSAASAGEGLGARFTLRLPAQGEAVAAGAPEPLPHTADLDLAGVQVLVVDDEPDVLDLLTRVLNEANADVLAAPSADAALRLFEQHRPAVLVSDIGMPDTDGYELLRRLRRLAPEQGGATPAIALTAFARQEDRARALESGFTLHLTKPVEPAHLLASIARLAGGQ